MLLHKAYDSPRLDVTAGQRLRNVTISDSSASVNPVKSSINPQGLGSSLLIKPQEEA